MLDTVLTLPNFVTIQKTSFCWFLSQGLKEEIQKLDPIFNFNYELEGIIYKNEFKMSGPTCNRLEALTSIRTYQVEFIIPMLIRSRNKNIKYKQVLLSAFKLPLMTPESTFIVNGCERVVVSQIIRSPGIYFEKIKNQDYRRIRNKKQKLETIQLGKILPTNQASISEKDLYFSSPSLLHKTRKNAKENHYQVIPAWQRTSIYSYSLNYLKSLSKKKKFFHFSVILIFKLYRILILMKHLFGHKMFYKWIKILTSESNIEFNSKDFPFTFFYMVLLIKIFINFKRFKSSKKILSKNVLFFSTILAQIQYCKQFFFLSTLSNNPNKSFLSLNNFIDNTTLYNDKKLALPISFFNTLKTIRPIIYFPKSFKDRIRYSYIPKTKKEKKKGQLSSKKLKSLHRYLETKTRLLLFEPNHRIKTTYDQKYQARKLYTATLIPDRGAWIRFKFQKNQKLNKYVYPIKYKEEDLLIETNKTNKTPIIKLLTDIGLNHPEIYKNLVHNDFFYFTNPGLLDSKKLNHYLLRFYINDFSKISELTKIFDPGSYTLGKAGRRQLNNRLNINICEKSYTITYEDIFAIVDTLIDLTLSTNISDDIDHLKNRRVRPIGELITNLLRTGLFRLRRILRLNRNVREPLIFESFVSFHNLNRSIKEFFVASQLSQYLDQTNPLALLTHRRRISGLGPGGFERRQVSFSVRDIHPSHFGRICPIETPEGQNVGLISSLATYARIDKRGFLETPYWRVINGKVLKNGNPIYLTADIEDAYKIAPADLVINEDNYIMAKETYVRYQQEFVEVSVNEIDLMTISPIQFFSIATSLVPFFEHDDANRALMGSNMQRQSIPLYLSQKPIVGTGLESKIAIDSDMGIIASESGVVEFVDCCKIIVYETHKKRRKHYYLRKYLKSNQQTCINQQPIVWEGEKIKKGQLLTNGPSIDGNELALGQNILVGYMPWNGYNFEDAILISERLVYENILSSIHIERHKLTVDDGDKISEHITKDIPETTNAETINLNTDGIIRVGSLVKTGDILIGKVTETEKSTHPEDLLLDAVFNRKFTGVIDSSYRMPKNKYGRVLETTMIIYPINKKLKLRKIHVYIAHIKKIKVGDKIAGRHGNKGIISRILPVSDMPFLPDGTPLDIILNPLGVPSRMNVGQLYECLLGFAGDKLNCRFKILPFDEMHCVDASRILINKKLRKASIINDQSWLFNPYAPGKVILIDGRTGKEFENPITIGNAYILKLIHLVDDKMHSRAIGPYSLITQQPLRGKAKNGGQRFGEMEVWALEAFGAAFTLNELLTLKSDDMTGRYDILATMVLGDPMPKFGVPESFKVLLEELRAIGLDISTYKIERFSNKPYSEVNLMETYDPAMKRFSPEIDPSDVIFEY